MSLLANMTIPGIVVVELQKSQLQHIHVHTFYKNILMGQYQCQIEVFQGRRVSGIIKGCA